MTNQSDRSGQPHQHGGQQGSTKLGGADPEETKVGNSAMERSKTSGGIGQRTGEDFSETDEQEKGGDAENPSETTGGSESGGEDKGAKR